MEDFGGPWQTDLMVNQHNAKNQRFKLATFRSVSQKALRVGFDGIPFHTFLQVSMARQVFLPDQNSLPYGRMARLGGIWPSSGSGGPKVHLKIR